MKEDRVKKSVKKVLTDRKRWGSLYSYWPVPYGLGASSLDCLVCYRGVFIGIETKAPGKRPTPRQEACIYEMVEAGAITLVIDSDDTTQLEAVLNAIRNRKSEAPGRCFRPRARNGRSLT